MNSIKIILFLFTSLVYSQTKRELLDQIESYQKSVVWNKGYDVEKSKLFEAMNVVGSQEYQKVIRESESRGFCEYYAESADYKETLTMEIANDKQPYRVTFSIKKESRKLDLLTGKYTDWQTSYDISQSYQYKLQYLIYTIAIGPIELPKELLEKIERYNQGQTKDRKRILKNTDY
ncbi:hypothetical protein [Flavobacterium sp.]|uniref:hypothetical protein n=1 Tax=Flavobacterium sp. TaxID=239 RepID=UPI00391AD7C8